MTTSTPRPWTIVRHGKGHGYDIVGGGPEPETVAYDVRNTRHEEALANARLIASAPELLEALRGCIGPTGHTWNCPGDDDGACAKNCQRARAAIARAEGRES